MRRIICALFLIYFCNYCTGQDTLLIFDDFETEWTGSYSSLYIDASKQETLQDISKKSDTLWIPQYENSIVKGVSSFNFWIRFNIKNISKINKLLILELKSSTLDRVHFYYYQNNILQDSSIRMGDALPFSEREIRTRFFADKLMIPSGESFEIYCQVGKEAGKITIPLKVYDAEFWQMKNISDYTSIGIILGFLIIFILIVILAFFFIKKSYLLFVILEYTSVLLSLLSGTGLGFQYIWPNLIQFQQTIHPLIIGLIVFFKSLFILYFFETSKYSWIHKIILTSIILHIATTILLVVTFLYPSDYFLLNLEKNSILIVLTNFLAYVLVFISLVLLNLKRKQKVLFYYTILSSIHLLIYIFGIVMYISKINIQGYYVEYIIFTSYAFEAIIVSIAIFLEQNKISLHNKDLQVKLEQKKSEALKNLLFGQVQERKRLSQDIHDGLSIRIFQLKKMLTNFSLTHKTPTPHLQKEIDYIYQDLRNFSHALDSSAIQEFGLKEAIDDSIYKIEMVAENIDILFKYQNNITLTRENETHFYFISQELLNNTLKHANAQKVIIKFQIHKNRINFFYSDDGIGLNKNSEINNGIGLKNIQSRVDLMDGNMEIENNKNQGIQCQINIPLK